MKVQVNVERVRRALCWIIPTLVILSACAQYGLLHASGASRHQVVEFCKFFDLDSEVNVPTWYQSLTLTCCGVVLSVIAISKEKGKDFRGRWFLLAAAFFFLSADEFCQMHEKLNGPMRRLLHAEGVFTFAWVIPGAIAAACFGAMFVRFLAHLPRDVRWRFVVAGLLYVGGAVGLESVESRYVALHGMKTAIYFTMADVEETMEMLGIAIFLLTLLSYASRTIGVVSCEIVETSARATQQPLPSPSAAPTEVLPGAS